jgi:hypothetical protein
MDEGIRQVVKFNKYEQQAPHDPRQGNIKNFQDIVFKAVL